MRRFIKSTGLVSLLVTFVLAAGIQGGVVDAASLSSVAPNTQNTILNPPAYSIANPNYHHDFYMRESQTQGVQDNVRLTAYYPAGTSTATWGNQSIVIDPDAVSPTDTSGGKFVCKTSPVAGANNNYITVTLQDPSNGANKVVYNIPEANICKKSNTVNKTAPGSPNNNVFYAPYPLPAARSPIDAATGMRKVNIDITFNSNITPANSPSIGVRLQVKGNTNLPLIGQLGGTSYNFPVLAEVGKADVNLQQGGSFNANSQPAKVVVPFGLPCNTTSAGFYRVGVYDADNGSFPANVLFRVVDITTGQVVNFSGPVSYGGAGNALVIPPGNLQDTNGDGLADRMVPPDGTANQTYVNYLLNGSDKYELQVFGVHPDNTVDLELPGGTDSIFGDPSFNCSTQSDTVVVTPQATGGSEFEVTQAGSFSFSDNVSNFPSANKVGSDTNVAFNTDWGYTEVAKQNANSRPNGNWDCANPNDPQNFSASPSNPATAKLRCDFRCSNGAGAHAPGAKTSGGDWGGGDLNCYIAPTLTYTCAAASDGTSSPNYSSGPIGVTFTSGSSVPACSNTVSLSGGNIGSQVCLRTNAGGASWSSPAPGVTASGGTPWAVQFGPDDTDCSNVVGKSYFKVYGGDIRTGGGVGAVVNSCPTSDTAGLAGWSHGANGGFAGAGTQLANFATGFIAQLVSGEYNNPAYFPTNPSQSSGTPPTQLAFSDYSAGGTLNGGYFGDYPACTDYVGQLPNGTVTETGVAGIVSVPDATTPGAVPAGKKTVRHVIGDLYITNNIKYSNEAAYGNSANIPLVQFVVEGNIYIDPSVTQLDGLYVAVPPQSGVTSAAGNIYTCSTPGNVATTTRNGCEKQLVVNGSFAAGKLYLQRDCGSQIQAQGNEKTVFAGGSSDQTCSAGNHAAEVFNYVPEQWIVESQFFMPSGYDSISSMPPVL